VAYSRDSMNKVAQSRRTAKLINYLEVEAQYSHVVRSFVVQTCKVNTIV